MLHCQYFSFPLALPRTAAALFLAAALLQLPAARAQSVGIGTPTPDASAALDVVSTTKGLLVPRVTQATRLAMGVATASPDPATGLLVYQTDGAQPGFWYNVGPGTAPVWTFINPVGVGDNLGNHTATADVQLGTHLLVGTGPYAGSAKGVGVRTDGGLDLGQNTSGNNLFVGYQAGQVSTGITNQFVGYQAGQANTTGTTNTFSGYKAGYGNLGGSGNCFTGYKAGYTNGAGGYNLFSGASAGYFNDSGNSNVFLGASSGYQNISGSSNVFIGFDAGEANTTGGFNVFSGYVCARSNTSGTRNVFSGYASGYNNTTGGYNVFSGFASGYNNTTGGYNVFIGQNSGYSNDLGAHNVFTGSYAGNANVNGNNNVFSGEYSGYQSSSGSNNAFLGTNSGFQNTTGSNNTALGSQSDFSATNLTNATAIGYQATVNASNKIRLGNSAVTVIEGQVPFTSPSDSRFKYQVRANVPGLRFITKLRPVTYRFDTGKLDAFTRTGVLPAGFTPNASAPVQTGFLAQEVEQAAKAVGFDFDAVHVPANARDHYGIAYSQLVVPLVQAVQEQQAQIEALQTQNAALQNQLSGDHAALLSMQQQLARLLGEGAQARK
ncbi:MAG: tail fiber domain-containing protein [Bacteroidota bacterium]|nr:tail fiber domain-containing protein [Bacteroidota bacterium]